MFRLIGNTVEFTNRAGQSRTYARSEREAKNPREVHFRQVGDELQPTESGDTLSGGPLPLKIVGQLAGESKSHPWLPVCAAFEPIFEFIAVA